MSTFKAGDVVQLKSGGLPMTVEVENTNGIVTCQWFDKNSILNEDCFRNQTLELVLAQKE